MEGEKVDVYKVYNKIASWYAENRGQDLNERKYLDELIKIIPAKGTVLDLGCGTGKPIALYLQSQGLDVTGVDASNAILEIAKVNVPKVNLILQDMRDLKLDKKFDAIIAWHSFFHLNAEAQRDMFLKFETHIKPGGILLFTSGDEEGEAWGMNGGENLYHASLSKEEYEALLKEHHFEVLKQVSNDQECGGATVWMAQYK